MVKIYYFWKLLNRNNEWDILWLLLKASDRPWNLSFTSSSWLRCRKDPSPSKRATSAVKHTQHFLLDGCTWTTPTGLGRNKSLLRKHMTGGWTRNKMGLLRVDWGIKCVASISSYLPIPLLFYGQSRIMLSPMNECGGKENQWHVPRIYVARPSPMKSHPFLMPCWDGSPPGPHDVRNTFPCFSKTTNLPSDRKTA